MAYKPPRGRIPLREQMLANRAVMLAMCPDQESKDRLMADLPPIAEKRVRAPNKPREGLSELQEQIRVIKWWDSNCERWGFLPVHLFHVPNGGSRGVIESVNLKRSGVRPGVPDLFLAIPANDFCGLFVEMKAEKGRVEADQEIVMNAFEKHDYRCVVAYSHEEAIDKIGKYLSAQR